MSKKVKEGLAARSEVVEEPSPVPEKVKTRGGKIGSGEGGTYN